MQTCVALVYLYVQAAVLWTFKLLVLQSPENSTLSGVCCHSLGDFASIPQDSGACNVIWKVLASGCGVCCRMTPWLHCWLG